MTHADYKITRWMPYLCRKPGEDPYLVRYLFLMVGHDAEKRQDDLLDGDTSIYTDELFMNEMSMIQAYVTRECSVYRTSGKPT